jgi:hypothetical protein
VTTFTEPTGGAWIREVNRRLAILERLPHRGASVAATVEGPTSVADTPSANMSVAFEADAISSSGTNSDPSLTTENHTENDLGGYPAFTTSPEVLEWSGVEVIEGTPEEVLDGGTPFSAGTGVIDGGTPFSAGTDIVDGGTP